MKSRVFALALIAGAVVTACSPGPGSAEWCKGVIDGKITPKPEEMLANAEKCAAHEMKQ